MSSKARPTVSTVVLSLLVIGVPLVLYWTVGLPIIWTILGVCVSLVFAAVTWAPSLVVRYSKDREPSHERIHVEQSWESPLQPIAVIQQIESALDGKAQAHRLESGIIRIDRGSDIDFRRRGVFSQKGRDALPIQVIVSATAQGPITKVSASGKDNLGWFLGPLGKDVKEATDAALSNLIASLREATSPASGRK